MQSVLIANPLEVPSASSVVGDKPKAKEQAASRLTASGFNADGAGAIKAGNFITELNGVDNRAISDEIVKSESFKARPATQKIMSGMF